MRRNARESTRRDRELEREKSKRQSKTQLEAQKLRNKGQVETTKLSNKGRMAATERQQQGATKRAGFDRDLRSRKLDMQGRQNLFENMRSLTSRKVDELTGDVTDPGMTNEQAWGRIQANRSMFDRLSNQGGSSLQGGGNPNYTGSVRIDRSGGVPELTNRRATGGQEQNFGVPLRDRANKPAVQRTFGREDTYEPSRRFTAENDFDPYNLKDPRTWGRWFRAGTTRGGEYGKTGIGR